MNEEERLACFRAAVQAGAIRTTRGWQAVVDAVARSWTVPASALPARAQHIADCAIEFVDWQLGGRERPSWLPPDEGRD